MHEYRDTIRKKAVLLAMGCLVCLLMMSEGASASAAEYATKIRVGDDVEVSLYTATMFRVRLSKLPGEKFPAKYEIPFVMGKTEAWGEVAYKRKREDGNEVIDTAKLRIKIARDTNTWSVWTLDGKTRIYPSDGPIYGMFRDGYAVFDSASALWEPTAYSRYSHWFYSPETKRYVDTYLADDLVLDQFFIYGPDYPALFAQLKELVGPEPLLPRKAYGFFQTQHLGCKGSQPQLMEVARQLRERHLPADTLIVDYEWGDGCPGGDEDDKYWGQLDWSPAYRSPLSPREMVAQLHEMHFDVMLIHHSVPDYPHRAESVKRDPSREWTSHAYDPDLWWSKLREQFAIGIDGTWQDTRKNDVTDSVIWKGIQDLNGQGRRVLFMGNRNMVEVDPWGMERDDRVPQSSLLASRRYPFRWTGDAHTTWSELQWHIDAITNTYGPMSGVDYITADAYAADWKQQARWNQFLAFTPVVRSHTMKPWDRKLQVQWLTSIMAFGEKRNREATDKPASPEVAPKDAPTAENSIRETLRLRYRLLPYIYSLAYEQYRTGFPMARPMVLAFPGDPNVKFNRERYEYMFGDAFLVAPVWADLNSMDVYLPKNHDWVDYWTKKVYAGGQTISYETTDVNRFPLFVKTGSIIPMGPELEWIDASRPSDPLTIDVYPGNAAAATELYEDDGISMGYQNGESATTSIEAIPADGSQTVAIHACHGRYSGQPTQRKYIVRVNGVAHHPEQVLRDGHPMEEGAAQPNVASWSYDQADQTVQVSFEKSADAETTVKVVTRTK